jgi:hypothetical protein
MCVVTSSGRKRQGALSVVDSSGHVLAVGSAGGRDEVDGPHRGLLVGEVSARQTT